MRLTYLDLGPRVRFRTSGIVDPSNSEMASPPIVCMLKGRSYQGVRRKKYLR